MKSLLTILVSLLMLNSLFAVDQLTPKITVNGTATMDVTPDKMLWSITIFNKGPELDKIAAENLKIVQETLKILKELGIDEKSLSTSSIGFGENLVYRRDRDERVKEGYYATTSVSFEVKDLTKYQSIWQALSKKENIRVNYAEFDTSSRIKYQNETRNNALLAAKEKASSMAKILGAEIGEPLEINEVIYDDYRYNRSNCNLMFTDDTPGKSTLPGKITVKMSVSAAFRLISLAK